MKIAECIDLTKMYRGNTTRALSDVTLDVEAGEVFTLLGRNGAGKTTLVRILATQLMPTSGEVRVLGFDVVKQAKQVRRGISVVPQEGRPFSPLTTWDQIYFTLLIKGFNRGEAKARTTQVLEELELSDYARVQAGSLSGGLRQRILVAMAMAANSELMFLDEPTVGLDVLSRRKLWSIIRRYRREGRSIILTTHYLDEAENVSDRVAVIHSGRLLISGTIEHLKTRFKEKVRVDVHNGFEFGELSSFGRVVEIGDRFRVFTGENEAREVADVALKRNVRVSIAPVSLEDVFIELVGRDGVAEGS